MTGLLVILVGLPSSGKSTLAQALKAYLPSCSSSTCPDIQIIDPDVFRGEKQDQLPFRSEDEPQIKEQVLRVLAQSLGAGQVTIIDDLNYYQSMRHDLLQIALNANVPYLIVFVNTPLEVCKVWNKQRGSKIPEDVISKIALKFDYFERYAWDRPDFTINPSSPTFSKSEFLQQLCGFLEKNTHRRPQLSAAARIKTAQPPSIKQLLDVRSRRILSEFLAKNAFYPQQKEYAKFRRDLLRKNPANLEETEQILQEFRKVLETYVLRNGNQAKLNPKKFNAVKASRS